MAQRYQIRGTLCGADAGDLRSRQRIAFFGRAAAHELERLRRHLHLRLGDRDALGDGFVPDVHHSDGTILGHMGKLQGGAFGGPLLGLLTQDRRGGGTR